MYPVAAHWAWDTGNTGCYTTIDDPTTFRWADCTVYKAMSMEIENRTVNCFNCTTFGAGWLTHLGYKDFAGSGIIHLLGGTCALVCCYLIGPRKGRFTEDGKPIDIPGHSVSPTALGGFMLFFGFLAFNGGSQVRNLYTSLIFEVFFCLL